MTNWYVGWTMVLAAFASGAGIGLFFYSESFLGGYGSFRRRILRLGHIALAALGMMNVLYSATSHHGGPEGRASSAALIVGGISMPLVCFLSAWRPAFRHLFFIPVVALMASVVQILRLGPP